MPETPATFSRIPELEDRVEALLGFKSWVHAYLDAHSVPHHPPGTHGAEGCRIGDRMDWLMNRLRNAESEVASLRRLLEVQDRLIATLQENRAMRNSLIADVAADLKEMAEILTGGK